MPRIDHLANFWLFQLPISAVTAASKRLFLYRAASTAAAATVTNASFKSFTVYPCRHNYLLMNHRKEHTGKRRRSESVVCGIPSCSVCMRTAALCVCEQPPCMYANSRPVCMRTGNAESQKRSAKGSNFRRQDLPLNKFPILDDRAGPLISYYSMKPTLLYFYSTFIRHASKFQHHQVGLAHRQTS